MSDERIRKIERDAAQGDSLAALALGYERLRTGELDAIWPKLADIFASGNVPAEAIQLGKATALAYASRGDFRTAHTIAQGTLLHCEDEELEALAQTWAPPQNEESLINFLEQYLLNLHNPIPESNSIIQHFESPTLRIHREFTESLSRLTLSSEIIPRSREYSIARIQSRKIECPTEYLSHLIQPIEIITPRKLLTQIIPQPYLESILARVELERQ